MGRRDVARGSIGGGEHIPAARPSGERLTTGVLSAVLAAGVVLDAVAEADRLRQVVAGVGVGGWALLVVALVVRRPSVLPVGLAGVGAAYGVFLSLHGGAVDAGALLVAAGLFAAAELGFWSVERTPSRSERVVLLRRGVWLAAGALFTALVGSLVLVLATGASGGVGLEAAGAGAAVLAVAALTWLTARPSV